MSNQPFIEFFDKIKTENPNGFDIVVADTTGKLDDLLNNLADSNIPFRHVATKSRIAKILDEFYKKVQEADKKEETLPKVSFLFINGREGAFIDNDSNLSKLTYIAKVGRKVKLNLISFV